MVPNRDGMTAMVDAIAFMVILMVALSVTIGYISPSDDLGDAGEILDTVTSVKVRLSDMTELEDDSLVAMTDILALDIVRGTGSSLEYVGELLTVYCSGRSYSLVLDFSDRSVHLGSDVEGISTTAHREVFVSTGGTLTMDLTVSS